MANHSSLRRLVIIFSAFQFFNVPAFSQQTPANTVPITSAQAKENIGQTKTVTGVVMKVTTLPKTMAFDFDGVFPNAPFNAVIFNEKLPNFDKATLESYQGKTVSVTGKIVTYKERVQIVVENPSQFSIVGEAPAATADSAKASTAAPEAAAASTPAPAPAPVPAHAAPTTTGTNLLSNPGFNKGQKDWEIPANVQVVADGESQVLKVKLNPGAPIIVKQVIKTPIAKTARFEVKLQAKLGLGSKLNDNMILRLGADPADALRYVSSIPLTSAWQDIKWSGTGASGDSITFSLEIPAGSGDLFLDNFSVTAN